MADRGLNVPAATRTLSAAALLLWAWPAFGLEQADCQERLKSVDERIESGNYPAQNVQMARQFRTMVMQSCAFIDEAQLADMMESVEQLLPTGTEAEQEAAREAKRVERKAELERERTEMEARRAARDAERPGGTQLPVSPILAAPPVGETRVARFVGRDDAMAMVDILDQDRYEGRLRLLYIARPSRDQVRLPQAKNHYYVVEAGSGGDLLQRQVAALPLGRTATAALRRGHDEIIFQYPVDPPRPGTRLERWSISGGQLVSADDGPMLPWSGRNFSPDRDQFDLPTSDGNLLFAATVAGSGGRQLVQWLKGSPDGQVLGQGELSIAAGNVQTRAVFNTRNGGGGILVQLMATGDDGIDSDLETPLLEEVAGVELTGRVMSEERLLIIGEDGGLGWESSALTRSLVWQGFEEVGKRGSVPALEKASAVTERKRAEHGANRNIVSFSAASGRPGAVGSIGSAGVGVLVNENDSTVDGIDRRWLLEFSADGSSRRTDLTGAFQQLDAGFVMLDALSADVVYLLAYGGGRRGSSFIVRLDGHREIDAHGIVTMSGSTIPNVTYADRGGVWLAGEGRPEDDREAVWLERVVFPP